MALAATKLKAMAKASEPPKARGLRDARRPAEVRPRIAKRPVKRPPLTRPPATRPGPRCAFFFFSGRFRLRAVMTSTPVHSIGILPACFRIRLTVRLTPPTLLQARRKLHHCLFHRFLPVDAG